MKMLFALAGISILIAALTSCSGTQPFHKEKLPDPSGYRAHFGDVDANGDKLVNWTEFKQHFPNTEPRVFKALDLNQDSAVDHDEWHKFKKAHGH